MFDVSYVMETIPQITKVCNLQRAAKKKKKTPTTSSETIHSSSTNKKTPHKLEQELHMPK
jgi:hypothetical protein